MAVHFRLANDCRLVVGASRGAIYHLGTGDLISIDADRSAFLQACEKNLEVDMALARSGARIGPGEAYEFVRELVSSSMGIISGTPVYVDEYQYAQEFPVPGFAELPIEVHTAHVEIGRGCDFDCQFCSPNWHHRYGCNSCVHWPPHSGTVMQSSEYREVLLDMSRLHCRRLVLSGGDPLTDPKFVHGICREAMASGINEIIMATNGVRLLNEDCLSLITGRVVHPLVCLPGSRVDDYCDESGCDDPVSEVRRGLLWMDERRIPYSVTIMDQPLPSDIVGGRRHRESLSLSFHPSAMYYTEVWQAGDSGRAFWLGKRHIPRTSPASYFLKRRRHPCLTSIIAISRDGSIRPCPHIARPIGDLRTESLVGILHKPSNRELWSLTKDSVAPCMDCEFRYACNDCRAAERTHDSCEEMTHCRYDPYVEEWN